MRKLKVFNYPWHLGHQFELQKFDWVDWSWLIQYHRQYNDKPRGDFFKGEWVDAYEKGKYDFALLHLDQQCFEDSIWERGKGAVYKELNQVINDIPKIVIMHGTPDYPEAFPVEQDLIDKMNEAVGDNFVIFNSYKAREQWGWEHKKNCAVIWHGLTPSEWYDLPKEPRVVTMIGPAGLDHYYDRAFLSAIKDYLLEEGITHCHITVDWSADNWEDYRQFIGRSLIYIHPSLNSPMPRSRTEAMLSGCCVLSTPHQDADKFIKHGENGFIINRNPKEVLDLVKSLISNYDKTLKIGQEGKKTALELFTHDRFSEDWMKVVESVLNIKIK